MTIPRRGILLGVAALLAATLLLPAVAGLVVAWRMEAHPSLVASAFVGALERGLRDAGRTSASGGAPGAAPGPDGILREQAVVAESLLHALKTGFRAAAGLSPESSDAASPAPPSRLRPSLAGLEVGLFPPRIRLEDLRARDDGTGAPDPFHLARAEIGLDLGLFPPRCAPHLRLGNLSLNGRGHALHAGRADLVLRSWPGAADAAGLIRGVAGIALSGARLDILTAVPGDGAGGTAPTRCSIRVAAERFGFQGDADAPRLDLSGLEGAIRFASAFPEHPDDPGGNRVPAGSDDLLKEPDLAFRASGNAVLGSGDLRATEIRLDGPEIALRRPADELGRLLSLLLPADSPENPPAAGIRADGILADGCRLTVTGGGIGLEADGSRARIDGLAFRAAFRSGGLVLPDDGDVPEPDRGVNGVLRLALHAPDADGGGLDANVPFRLLIGRPNPAGRAESGRLILTEPEISLSRLPGALEAPLARLSALAGAGSAPAGAEAGPSGPDAASLLPESCAVEVDGARLRVPGFLEAVAGLALRGSPEDASAEFSFDGDLDCGGDAGVPIRLKGGAHGAIRPASGGADGPSGALAFSRTDLSLGGDAAVLEDGLLDIPADGSWSLTGRLASEHFGLTRWLGILRRLTPGLQAILDDFSDARVSFRLDGAGLDVAEAETDVAGVRFRGRLGVASWTNPVLALDMRTEEEIDILRIFPEIGLHPIPAPVFEHESLTDVLITSDSDDGELILGYDILLGAKRVGMDPASLAVIGEALAGRVGRLVAEGPSVRISPDRTGYPVVAVERGALLGGGLRAGIFFGGDASTLECRIDAELRHADAAALAGILPDSPLESGRIRASAALVGRVRDDDGSPGTAFLKSLRGTVSLAAERGRLAPHARGFLDRCDRCSAEASLLDVDGGRSVVRIGADLLASSGNGGGRAEARIRLDAPCVLGGREGMILSDAPLTASLKAAGPGLPRGFSAAFDGRVGLRLASGILDLRRAILDLPGLTVMVGKASAALSPAPSWKGHVQVSSDNLARLAPLIGGGTAGIPAEFRNPLLTGEFEGDAAHFAMTDMVAVAGPVRLAGSAGLRWNGARPMLAFDLAAESIDADGIAKILAARGDGSGTPWNLRPLRAFDAGGELRVASLRARDMRFTDVRIPLRLHAGTLHAGSMERFGESPGETRGRGHAVPRIRAGIYGGSMRAAASCVIHDHHADLRAVAALDGVDVGQAGGDFLRSHQLEGRMTAGAEISLRLSGPDGTGRTFGERILPDLRGSWHADMERGALVRLQDGLPRGRASILAQAHASGIIENGVIRSRSLHCLDGPLEIVGGGDSTFNLGSRAISVSLRVRRGRLIDIPFSLSGRLDDDGGRGPKALLAYSIGLRETVMNVFRGMFGMAGAPAAPPAWNHTHSITEPQS